VSKPKLVDPRDTTGLDVTGLLSPAHRAHLDLLGSRYALFSGWQMKEDDDGEDDDTKGDDEEDDVVQLEPDDLIKVGDKKLTVAQIQGIMAKEKRQGKKAGRQAVLDELGFASVEEAQAALKGATKPKPKKGEDDDEADTRASERETAAEERERKAKAKERRADIRGALRDHGVSRDDLDDAMALLDRAVDTDYDDDDLEDAVEELKQRRPGFFGEDDGDDGEGTKPRPKAPIPTGRPKSRNKAPQKTFGAGGLERAKRMGFIKDKD
jgi:hypothetical protein